MDSYRIHLINWVVSNMVHDAQINKLKCWNVLCAIEHMAKTKDESMLEYLRQEYDGPRAYQPYHEYCENAGKRLDIIAKYVGTYKYNNINEFPLEELLTAVKDIYDLAMDPREWKIQEIVNQRNMVLLKIN